MSGKKLVLIVVLPFLALAAIGYWLTRLEAPPPPPPPTAEPAPVRPSAKDLVASARGQPLMAVKGAPSLVPAGTPPPSPAPPSPTPVMDALSQALVEVRPKPVAQPVAEEPKGGELSKEEVQAAIKAVTPLVRQCFEDVAKRYPGPHKVTLSFSIQGQGLGGYLKDGEIAESTIADPFVQTCFLEAIADAKFPAPRGGGIVKVTYPFLYRPAEDAGR